MTSEFSSLSAIDGEVLWRGVATSSIEIQARMKLAAEASSRWQATSIEERASCVRRFGQQLAENRELLADLISREVGKLPWDANTEVGAAIAKIEVSIEAWKQRGSELAFDGGTGADGHTIERRIRYMPIGVALVLGPFNFPLHLPGGQIIPALLAGNAVVFKPSEQAMAVGQWMVDAWNRVGLPKNLLQMVTGGVETAVAAIDAPEVGGVFLTGGRAAGRSIHRQLAGRPGVLLALELGGNNPIVITDGVDPDIVATIVSFSSFVSAGQRCTCARRAIFVDGPSADSQLTALVRRTKKLRIGMPGDQPAPQIGPVISADAAEDLRQVYRTLVELGCEPLVPFHVDSRAGNLLHPCIVDASRLDHESLRKLGDMEWFGPILVVQRVEGFDQAIRAAAETPYGLAASLLGGNRAMFERFVSRVRAGVVNWNAATTGAAGTLPFGGLGDSGNHRPAGFFAIDFCHDPVASLEHAAPSPADLWEVAK